MPDQEPPQAATNDTATFFGALLDTVPPEKYALLWTLQDKRSSWVSLANDGPADVANRALALSAKDMDVYVAVSVADQAGGESTRIKSDNSAGLVGLWADVDIADLDVHKKWNLPPDEDSACDLLNRAGMDPTLLVHSGHGLQAWWLFHEFWTFDNDAERAAAATLAQQWNTTLRVRAAESKWTLDSTFDLARVMRVPGTWNRKGVPMPVRLIVGDGPRWNPSDFEHFLVDDRFLASRGVLPDVSYQPDKLDLSEARQPPFEKFSSLLANDDIFDKTWNRKRRDFSDQSASSYDLSVATQCASAGFTDQEIADTIFAWRRHNREDVSKALRSDYMRRTISKARDGVIRDQSVEIIDEAFERLSDARQSDDPELVKESRSGALEALSQQIGFAMSRVIKYLSDPPSFRIETVTGLSIDMGESSNILNWFKFKEIVWRTAGVSIPRFSQPKWDAFIARLPEVWEEVDIGMEATDQGQMHAWLTQYLMQRPPAPSLEDAALSEYPYIDEDARTVIFGPSFKRWLYIAHQERVTPKELGKRLRHYGCETGSVNLMIDGVRTSRSIWRLPLDPPKVIAAMASQGLAGELSQPSTYDDEEIIT